MLTGVYFVYLLLSCVLTVWVARSLSVAGRPFLVQVFHGNESTADAVNQLLIVGFYLMNAGLIGITLREYADVYELKTSIELVSLKFGRTILVLGVMHFFNLITLCWLRDRRIRYGSRPDTPRGADRDILSWTDSSEFTHD